MIYERSKSNNNGKKYEQYYLCYVDYFIRATYSNQIMRSLKKQVKI